MSDIFLLISTAQDDLGTGMLYQMNDGQGVSGLGSMLPCKAKYLVSDTASGIAEQ